MEVSSWLNKMQDFINRWHDQRGYEAAMEALEKLQDLLPALESFGDASSFVTSTVKKAHEDIAKVNSNIPKAKARFESAPLIELVNKSSAKLTVCVSPLGASGDADGLFLRNSTIDHTFKPIITVQ